MLDAIVITSKVYQEKSNSDVALARTVGYGISNNTLGYYDGKFWRKVSNNYILSDSFTSQRVYDSWVSTNASKLEGLSDNGLLYSVGYGSRVWGIVDYYNPGYGAKDYCADQEMRLPELSETRASTSAGIPSLSGWTWTNTNNPNIPSGGAYKRYTWSGTSTSSQYVHLNYKEVFRCIK